MPGSGDKLRQKDGRGVCRPVQAAVRLTGRDRNKAAPARLWLPIRLLPIRWLPIRLLPIRFVCRCGPPAGGTQAGKLTDIHFDALRVPERDTEVSCTFWVAKAVPSGPRHHA